MEGKAIATKLFTIIKKNRGLPQKVFQLYSKSKLEVKSNLDEFLLVNCNFIHDSTPT